MKKIHVWALRGRSVMLLDLDPWDLGELGMTALGMKIANMGIGREIDSNWH